MIVPATTYLKAWAALLVLLLLTIGASFLNLGAFNLPLALVIAFVKAGLIVVVFMHLRSGAAMVRLAAAAGLLWFVVFLVLTFNDYLTRHVITWLASDRASF